MSETEECESLQISLFPYLEFLCSTRAEQVLITPVLIAEQLRRIKISAAGLLNSRFNSGGADTKRRNAKN